MRQEILNEVIGGLTQFKVSIYLVGSIAYKEYEDKWSDIDIVIISEENDHILKNRIGKLVVDINSKYKGLIAGGGDAVIDIEMICKKNFSNMIVQDIQHKAKTSYYYSIARVFNHGKLIYGNDESEWVCEKINDIPKEDLVESLIHSVLERINYYQSIFDTGIMGKGSLDRYAPHKKYKVIIWLYVHMAMSIATLIDKKEIVNKNKCIDIFKKLYPDRDSEWDIAFKLRKNWDKGNNSLSELKLLAAKLPYFINWFLDTIKQFINLEKFYLIRGRKKWHFRCNDYERIRLYINSMKFHEDEFKDYINLAENKEISFIEKNEIIQGIVFYSFNDDQLVVYKMLFDNQSIKDMLIYYLHLRAIDKQKVNGIRNAGQFVHTSNVLS